MSLAHRVCDYDPSTQTSLPSIECDECGHAVVLRPNEESVTFRAWLRRHGWECGATDVCSDCAEKHQHARDRENANERRAS